MQPRTQELEAAFYKLTKEWIKDTAFHTNDYFALNQLACQQIVEMGEEVLPLVFRELENTRVAMHWPYVLRAITRTDPSPSPQQKAAGFVGIDVRATHDAWLKWGREHGYHW